MVDGSSPSIPAASGERYPNTFSIVGFGRSCCRLAEVRVRRSRVSKTLPWSSSII
jgi:hypothetical protein